jgi:hypothetical protein
MSPGIHEILSMSPTSSLLFSSASTKDIRMLLDRLLSPQTAHPLVGSLLDSVRECQFGEAQLALASLRRQLGVDVRNLGSEVAHLLFVNASHANEPFAAFDFLLDSGFEPKECATDVMEHLALGRYRGAADMAPVFAWFLKHGGLIPPQSQAAWKALQAHYPDSFCANQGRHEAIALDAYIESSALEVREVARL